jgi:hypothetical protein
MSDPQAVPTTTNAGIPVESDEHSLTIGPDGPILGLLDPVTQVATAGHVADGRQSDPRDVQHR